MLLLMLCYCYFQVDACCKTSELGKVMVFDLGFFWPMFYRYEFLGFENVFWKLQVVSLHLLGIEFSCVIPLLSCSLHAFSTLRRSKLKWLAQNGGDPYSALLLPYPQIFTMACHPCGCFDEISQKKRRSSPAFEQLTTTRCISCVPSLT